MEPMLSSNPSTELAPDEALSESDFLERQSEQARIATRKALDAVKASLAEGMSPRIWTRRYPIAAVGTALAAGFIATVTAVPSKEERDEKRAERAYQALHPTEEPATSGKEKAERRSLWKTVLFESILLLRPVLTSIISRVSKVAVSPESAETDYQTTASQAQGHDNAAKM